MDERERYDKGMAVRREVLGDTHVDRTLKNKTAFNGEFQDLITRYAWGEMWTRPVLDDRSRRLMVLAMLVAMKSWEEFELHVRAGFEHELSQAELKEVLMLAAIYCGVPAANSAFHLAQEVFAEMDAAG